MVTPDYIKKKKGVQWNYRNIERESDLKKLWWSSTTKLNRDWAGMDEMQ
jgi:hypothetical protein